MSPLAEAWAVKAAEGGISMAVGIWYKLTSGYLLHNTGEVNFMNSFHLFMGRKIPSL